LAVSPRARRLVWALGAGGTMQVGVLRRGATLVVGVAAAALALAACGSSTASPAAGHEHLSPIRGGVVTYAEASGSSPDWIFPVVPGSDFTVANLSQFIPLMYKPLYVMNFTQPTLNYASSIGNKPVWSHGNTVVTITLKHYVWSNGLPVTARDITFFINLVKAAGSSAGLYAPGDFPQNVKSMSIDGQTKLSLTLTKAYNPTYYDDNSLSEITPIPQADWDRLSLTGRVGNYDTTLSGAKKVWRLLNSYAQKTSTYSSSNPIWGVTDGPFTLQSFGGTSSPDIFVPNPHYSGHRATISRFEELPFTSNAAEYNDLRSGNAVTIGYVPSSDIPTVAAVKANGDTVSPSYSWFIDFILPNFANPQYGSVFKQLYIRQALQHLIDQDKIIKYFFHGHGIVGDGPVPLWPPNNRFIDSVEKHNPYPFSVTAARSLLATHGWRIRAGIQTCESASLCGSGIKIGTKLVFHLLYTSGSSSNTEMMELFQSDAAKAGITLVLQAETFDAVVGIIGPCTPGHDGITASSPACTWQLGTWGGWTYGPFPSGGLLFGAGNSGSYVNSTVEKLIVEIRQASTLGPFDQYESLIARDLPFLWLPQGASLVAIAKDLAGPGRVSAFGNIAPNRWYFTRSS